MNSYFDAFNQVMAEFPSAYISSSGYETDTMFVLPPGDPDSEGSPFYFVPKDGSKIFKLGSGAWREIDRILADPTLQSVAMNGYSEAVASVRQQYPRAFISDSGSETDELFIVPPKDPENEGAPTYLVSKKDGSVSKLSSCPSNWPRFYELYGDPSIRAVSTSK